MSSSAKVSHILFAFCSCGESFTTLEAAELHKTEEEIYKMMAEGKLTDEPTTEAKEEKERKHTVTPHLRHLSEPLPKPEEPKPLPQSAIFAGVESITKTINTPTISTQTDAHDRLTEHLKKFQTQQSDAAGDRLRQHLEKLRSLAAVATETKEKPAPPPATTAAPASTSITESCPWCACKFQVEQADVHCGIFRHAQFKSGEFVDPHMPQPSMQQLLKFGVVNGCGNPIRMTSFEGKWKVEKCAWTS